MTTTAQGADTPERIIERWALIDADLATAIAYLQANTADAVARDIATFDPAAAAYSDGELAAAVPVALRGLLDERLMRRAAAAAAAMDTAKEQAAEIQRLYRGAGLAALCEDRHAEERLWCQAERHVPDADAAVRAAIAAIRDALMAATSLRTLWLMIKSVRGWIAAIAAVRIDCPEMERALYRLQSGDDLEGLPRWGDAPEDTDGVWSWDARQMIAGAGAMGGWSLVSRPEVSQ